MFFLLIYYCQKYKQYVNFPSSHIITSGLQVPATFRHFVFTSRFARPLRVYMKRLKHIEFTLIQQIANKGNDYAMKGHCHRSTPPNMVSKPHFCI